MTDRTPRMSPQQYQAMLRGEATTSKFNAKRSVSRDGIHFPSKIECAVYETLVMQQRQGELVILALQAPVQLTRERRYKTDFLTFNKKRQIHEWHEVKGAEGDRYLENLKLWELYGPGPLIIWKGDYKKPFPVKTIIPKEKT